jgi:IclR family acetate operon transcriptional repressor
VNKDRRLLERRSPAHGSGTVRRAVRLLSLLAQQPGGAGLSEIARLSKLHHTTAHRLLSTLGAAGLVACRHEDRKYRLGLGLLELAGALVENLEIRTVARPTLLSLAQATGETVHLAALDGHEMVFLDRVDGVQPVTLRTRVGFRAPAHVTAVGKAVLAFSTPGLVARILAAAPLTRHTPKTITKREAFLAQLDLIRRHGYAVDNEEHRLTIRCVGAPIFDHTGAPVAALSIAGPMFRLSQRRVRELVRLVKDAAAEVSRALGHRAALAAHRSIREAGVHPRG